uniref:Uncharacterized protein n=1 Tax=Arundo donax TaxID=35708 RepID=A0A0A9H034_ARUDO
MSLLHAQQHLTELMPHKLPNHLQQE